MYVRYTCGISGKIFELKKYLRIVLHHVIYIVTRTTVICDSSYCNVTFSRLLIVK